MDILVSKLHSALCFAGVGMIAMAFCGAVALVIRLSRGGMHDATAKRLAGIWISVVLPFLLLVGGSMLLVNSLAWRKFNTIMMQKPNRLVITSEGKTNEISDALVIVELFQIVSQSKKVMAHHSHRISDVKLLFPQSGYIYTLGRDSEYPNEFWFGWNGIAGRERDWLSVGASLGQLRSDELDRWVKNYAPPETGPQMQKAR